MKRLKIGPELKMPKFKRPSSARSSLKGPKLDMPPFLADIYYDLRDRRLLPLVAVVVVAIVAVPFLLGGSDDPAAPPAASGGGGAQASALGADGDETLTVVQTKPGLRDYRKRLKARTPTDPFKQRYTGLPGDAKLESTVSTSPTDEGDPSSEVSVTDEGDSVTVEVDDGAGSNGSGGGPPAGKGGSGHGQGHSSPPDGTRFYAYRPDVRFGVAGSESLTEHQDLPVASLLPKKDPATVFLGVTEDGKRAVFDISAAVVLVKGDGKCVGGRKGCELLFLGAGEAVTLMGMAPGRTFRLAVGAIDFVSVERPKSAGASATEERQTPALSQHFSK